MSERESLIKTLKEEYNKLNGSCKGSFMLSKRKINLLIEALEIASVIQFTTIEKDGYEYLTVDNLKYKNGN